MKLTHAVKLAVIGAAVVVTHNAAAASNGSSWSWESDRTSPGEVNARNRSNQSVTIDRNNLPLFVNINQEEAVESRQFPYAIRTAQEVWLFESATNEWTSISLESYDEHFTAGFNYSIQPMDSHQVSANSFFNFRWGLNPAPIYYIDPMGSCGESGRPHQDIISLLENWTSGIESRTSMFSFGPVSVSGFGPGDRRCWQLLERNDVFNSQGYEMHVDMRYRISSSQGSLGVNPDGSFRPVNFCREKFYDVSINLAVFPFTATQTKYSVDECFESYTFSHSFSEELSPEVTAIYHEDAAGNKYFLGQASEILGATSNNGTITSSSEGGRIDAVNGRQYNFSRHNIIDRHPAVLHGLNGTDIAAFFHGPIVFYSGSYLPDLPISNVDFERFYISVDSGRYEF